MNLPPSGRRWPDELAPLLMRASALGTSPQGQRERWMVRGGPGTGKTSLLVDLVRAGLEGGVGIDDILVVTTSAAAGASLLDSATADVGSGALAGTDNPVRTVHSLAYGIVRLAASRAEAPPPRLLTGAEHDSMIQETLLGELEDGATGWPEALRPALATVGFARELRDLLLRSLERGFGPRELSQLGREASRPEWVAAAGFFRRHEEQLALRGGLQLGETTAPMALNAAELVGAALSALAEDPDLLTMVRGRRLVAVDDAHQLDPLAGELLATVGGGAELFVVVEDRDQSVYRFRGADGGLARAVVEQDGHVATLMRGHRMAPAVAAVAHRISERLPGDPRHRVGADAESGLNSTENVAGSVTVRVLGSEAAEAAAVADFLRRRHVLDGIPWSQMAVLSRTAGSGDGRGADALLHALDSAGVPVVDAGAEFPPAHDPVAAALLGVIRSAFNDPDPDTVLGLLTGPIGRADPVALRRLRRGIRRSGLEGDARSSSEILRTLLVAAPEEWIGQAEGLTKVELAPLARVRAVRDAVSAAAGQGLSVEEVLWAGWAATQLQHRLVSSALAHDVWSRQADRSLDAIIALFDHAADYVDQVPGGSVLAFCDMVATRDLPAPRRADTRIRPEAVSVLSAHAAVGKQWQAVAVYGVQDGTWPAPPRRGGILWVDELVDLSENLADGPAPGESERIARAAAARAAEERRLFYVACSRAQRYLHISAVESAVDGDRAASRFMDEIADLNTTEAESSSLAIAQTPAILCLPHLVAELRSAVYHGISAENHSNEGTEVVSKDKADLAGQAASLLVGLHEAGVTQADPKQWYGVAQTSTSANPFPAREGGPITVLSPSAFGAVEQCPLRWFLERIAGESGGSVHLSRGTAVHGLVQAIAGGVPERAIEELVQRRWPVISSARGWFIQREISEILEMASAFRAWQAATRKHYTCIDVEAPFEFVLPENRDGSGGQIAVRGRIDRLERTESGAVAAIDVKTSKTATTKADAQAHPQLALYQLAIADTEEPGGGELLFLGIRGRSGPATRQQDPLNPAAAEDLRERVRAAAQEQRGPHYKAREGSWCAQCSVRSCCPIQSEGRQVVS